jgi:HlyD family secretion protein
VLLLAYFLLQGRDNDTQLKYSLTKISQGGITSSVSATGSLKPMITVQVGSQVSGTIQHLYVDFNSRVKKGEVIAQIEPSLFRTQVAQANANLKSAIASRDKARVQVLDAKRQYERKKKLRNQNMISVSEVEASYFNHEAAKVEYKVRAAAVEQARAALEQAQVNLNHSTIHAPIDGVVISRDVDVGQTVAASLQAPTLFTIARNLTQMQIETDVDEAYIGRIREGQPVRFTVFSYPGRPFTGRVAQVRLNPRVESGVVKYNCIIHVQNPDLSLKPGMTATVSIIVARKKKVLRISNPALRYVPPVSTAQLTSLRKKLRRGQGVIWKETAAGLKPVIVTLGIIGEKQTEISSPELKPGMKIAIPLRKKDTRRGFRRRGLRLF